MSNDKLKAGDVVKSTTNPNQLMTINIINRVECVYFDENGNFHTEVFNEDELEFVR